MFRIESENVTDRPYKKGMATGHSNFLVTVSTNRRAPNSAVEALMLNDLAAACRYVFNDDNNLFDLLIFLDDEPRDPSAIKSVDVKYAVETGNYLSQGGRIHAHVLIKIAHNTKIRLSIPMIRATFMDYYDTLNATYTPPTNLYVNIKTTRPEATIEDYLEKTV